MKRACRPCIKGLTGIYQQISKEESSPYQLRNSYTILLFKGKGDALQYGKYRGWKLLEYGMKIGEKVLVRRLRNIISIGDSQLDLCLGSTSRCYLHHKEVTREVW